VEFFFCEVGGRRERGRSERRDAYLCTFFLKAKKMFKSRLATAVAEIDIPLFRPQEKKRTSQDSINEKKTKKKNTSLSKEKTTTKKTKTAKKEHVPERHNMLNLKYKAVFVDGKIVYELRNEIVDTFTDEEWRAFKKMAMITKQSLDQAKQELKNELDRLMGRVVLTDYDNYDYAHESDNEGEGMECEMSFSDTCLSEEEDFLKKKKKIKK